MYQKQKVLLATKHQKERVIAPVFFEELMAEVIVPENFDTDQFGTFTGEIERKLTPQQTCIEKAKQAATYFGYDYALASEGSFGPHPNLYVIPADIEIIAFVDIKNDIVITEHTISQQTNFSHQVISANDDYSEYLQKIDFPSHGLILRDASNNEILAKGIQDATILQSLTQSHFRKHENTQLQLETDMRAMMNPTRMKIIHHVAKQLATRLNTHCPSCHFPGFGRKSAQGKLPCSACGAESTLHQNITLSCVQCEHKNILPRDDGLTAADPMYCSFCNP